jgi:hypothetical protein
MNVGQVTVRLARLKVLPSIVLRSLMSDGPKCPLVDRLPCHIFGDVEPFSMHTITFGAVFPLSIAIELPVDKLLDSTSESDSLTLHNQCSVLVAFAMTSEPPRGLTRSEADFEAVILQILGDNVDVSLIGIVRVLPT